MRKVKNKKVIRRIADQSLKSRKSRNLIAVLAIALTSILFTALFVVGGSIVQKQQEATMRQVGGSAHAGYKYLTPEEYEIVKQDPKLKSVSARILIGGAVNEELKKLPTEISCYEDLEAKWSFCYPTHGEMPEAEDEIVTSDLVLEALGVPCRVGAEVLVKMVINQKEVEKTFVLSGWFEGDRVAMAQVMSVSETFARETVPQDLESVAGRSADTTMLAGYICADFNFGSSFRLEQQVADLTQRCGFDEEIETGINWAYLGGDIDAGTTALLLVMLLVIITSGYLLIYNIFYINVYSDIRYYGLLKTIGTTGKQLKKMVRRQAYLLSVIGIPLGLLIGVLIGGLLLPAVMSILIFQETASTEAAVSPWILLGSAAFSLLTVHISCMKPCRIVSGISPVEAVRFTEGSQRKKEKKEKTKKTRGVSASAMAAANMKRNKKRAFVVILSLSLSLVLLNSIYSLVQGFDMDKYVEARSISDYMVTDATTDNAMASYQETEGVTEDFLEALSRQKGVTETGNVYYRAGYEYSFEPEEFQGVKTQILQNPELESYYEYVFGEDWQEYLKSYEEENSIDVVKFYGIDKLVFDKMEIRQGELDWEKFKTGNYILVNQFEGFGEEYISYFPAGDTVTLTGQSGSQKQYQVLAEGDMPYAAQMQRYGSIELDIFLPSEEFLELLGEQQPMKTMFNVEDSAADDVEMWISSYCETVNDDLTYTSRDSMIAEFYSLIQVYLFVGGLLCLILAVIGILNFVNTMAASILSRRREFAMLEAVGMTGKQLKQMLCMEGIYYAAVTIGVSLVLGSLLNLTLIRGTGTQMFFFSPRFTVLPIVLCIPAVLFVVILVPVIGYWQIRKRSVVERMGTVE